jgi:hypothetical protein
LARVRVVVVVDDTLPALLAAAAWPSKKKRQERKQKVSREDHGLERSIEFDAIEIKNHGWIIENLHPIEM